jgi:hypothetical protein
MGGGGGKEEGGGVRGEKGEAKSQKRPNTK